MASQIRSVEDQEIPENDVFSTGYHKGVVVITNSEAYCNEEVMSWWIKEFVIPGTEGGVAGLAPHERLPSLFALDAVVFHRTEEVKSMLKQHNIIPAAIPAGCTSLLQPVDVSVNSPFTKQLQGYMDERPVHLEDGEEEALTVGLPISSDSALGERRILVSEPVGEVWKSFTNDLVKRDMIINSFQKRVPLYPLMVLWIICCP
jgi:hypothetical protein